MFVSLVVIGVLLILVFVFAIAVISGNIPRCIQFAIARVLRVYKQHQPMNFDTVDHGIILGSVPTCIQDLNRLEDAGVVAVVALLEPEELHVPLEVVEQMGFRTYHQNIPDHYASTQDQLMDAVLWIEDILKCEEGSVYLHCNRGRGRSAVVAAACLMRRYEWNERRAYDRIRGKRKIAKLDSLCGLKAQWRALKNFEANEVDNRPLLEEESPLGHA